MANWLERARREILEKADLATAVTAKRNLTAVMAVTHLGESGISRVSNDTNGSALAAGFWKIESSKTSKDTFQRAKIEISKSVGLGTDVTDERNLRSVGTPPYGNNCLPYHERRALYAKQNGLYLRLKRRMDKYERLTRDPETITALEAWAGDHAFVELYAGRRSWAEHRRIIYTWAQAELASIRSQREYNIGGKHHAY
ncbi:MAG: hypothetical protein HZB29_07500 [Nitrospinae bacterium]|nr:hypothetical protein [Nitrospinota bacterium]